MHPDENPTASPVAMRTVYDDIGEDRERHAWLQFLAGHPWLRPVNAGYGVFWLTPGWFFVTVSDPDVRTALRAPVELHLPWTIRELKM